MCHGFGGSRLKPGFGAKWIASCFSRAVEGEHLFLVLELQIGALWKRNLQVDQNTLSKNTVPNIRISNQNHDKLKYHSSRQNIRPLFSCCGPLPRNSRKVLESVLFRVFKAKTAKILCLYIFS